MNSIDNSGYFGGARAFWGGLRPQVCAADEVDG